MSDAALGAKIWDVLHAIAINFPDKGEGLSTPRLQGYYNFFSSLKYVLPRDSWRRMWKDATARSLTEEEFKKARHHKQVFRWLSEVHDDVRRALGKPVVEGKNWYPHYKKYRSSGGSGSSANNNQNTNALAVATIEKMLRRRVSSMDAYLEIKFGPSYSTWDVARKKRQRDLLAKEAATYYFRMYTKLAAQNIKGWNQMSQPQRREHVIATFDKEHERTRQAIARTVARPFRLNWQWSLD